MSRARLGFWWGAALLLALGSCFATGPLFAAPKPAKEVKPNAPVPPAPPELVVPPQGGAQPSDAPPVDVYRALLRDASGRSPEDTLGNGLFAVARGLFYAGKIEEAMARAEEFTHTYTRNLRMNDAMEMILLGRWYRDFDEEPLRAYAHVLALRDAGRADSAVAVAQGALARWPGAGIRYHLHYALAELARERGNHAEAIAHALAVADSSSKSRLAPAALRLAGDETLASGQGPQRALKLYQELLERFPDSPLAPDVRAQVIEMRKKLQL
jgi:tetratricopeptide (TPR) repeat protein